jgi:hypothetical protein
MKITHRADMVKAFAEKILGHHYNEKTLGRRGWHRSDAIACPLKAYWRMTGEVKGQFRSKDVGILMVGEMAHIVLERGFEVQEQIIKIGDIAITVDATHNKQPVEIKTTRKKIYRREDLPRSWIEQLSIAMAVMGADTGFLMIVNIINFGVTVWEFAMTERDRELVLHTFVWQIMAIADSVKKKDPTLLTPKHSDCMWCYYRPSRKQKGCPYYKPVKKTTKKKS